VFWPILSKKNDFCNKGAWQFCIQISKVDHFCVFRPPFASALPQVNAHFAAWQIEMTAAACSLLQPLIFQLPESLFCLLLAQRISLEPL